MIVKHFVWSQPSISLRVFQHQRDAKDSNPASTGQTHSHDLHLRFRQFQYGW